MEDNTAVMRKVKVTASLDPDIVKAMDEYIKRFNLRSRSQLIEKALRAWQKEAKKRMLEKQVEAYYRAISDDEREDDRQWCETAAQSASRLWEE